MTAHVQLRRLLPISQTFLAAVFGGWGLWQRTTSINNSWLGWNSTLRFHVWPWPFKFAVIQNAPAFVIGGLMSWPLDILRPGLPEWVSLLPSLLLVPMLWYLIGSWLDRRHVFRTSNGKTAHWPWVLLCIVTTVSLSGALSSMWLFGSYTTFIPFGIAFWIILGIGMLVFGRHRKRIVGTT